MAKRLGLALSSGAARGWAHVGVLRGLKEIGVTPDVITGCSVGALVGGAYLLDALDDLERWARELTPLSALGSFSLRVQRGGMIDVEPAFDAFREKDQPIENLPVRFGAVATDLATGEEVIMLEGSVIEAARASSAIPVVFHAVERNNRWLVDGALSNPTPVNLARDLGAEITIAVDVNAAPRTLDRFSGKAGLPALAPTPPPAEPGVTGALAKLIDDTRAAIKQQYELAKARANAAPHLFETAYAAADIFQMQLARARSVLDAPEVLLRPNMRDALPTAFDRADEFIEIGRQSLLAERERLEALLSD